MIETAVLFNSWTRNRAVATLGSNSGSSVLPFQGWRRFKEAFAPEFVARAIAESDIPVHHCIDPFGGSGTTALACQFLGVRTTTIEINPFLADLIAAKTSVYDCDKLAGDLGQVVRVAKALKPDFETFVASLPATFVERPTGKRSLFSADAALQILRLRTAIDMLELVAHRRLFRILLGGVLIDLSNVVVSGKGRRYRRLDRNATAHDVEATFTTAVQRAAGEIYRHRERASYKTTVITDDARQVLNIVNKGDVAVFSPPYCNSFDYTDVYNVELWMLGYLQSPDDNARLRASTLCSHVQHARDYPKPPQESPLLDAAINALGAIRAQLWDRRLPDMIGGYFADLAGVLSALHSRLHDRAKAWIVVADSRYGAIDIRTAAILAELAPGLGFHLEYKETFRSIRTSAQQGGLLTLAETLLVLRKV